MSDSIHTIPNIGSEAEADIATSMTGPEIQAWLSGTEDATPPSRFKRINAKLRQIWAKLKGTAAPPRKRSRKYPQKPDPRTAEQKKKHADWKFL